MLRLTLEEHHIEYENGFNAAPWTVTRYHGEHWEQVGSDLLCGVADVFPDVGIVATGKSSSMSLESVKSVTMRGNSIRVPAGDRWAPIESSKTNNRAVYSFAEQHGWVFVPASREAVEDVVSWTMWATKGEQGFRSTAFPGYREFRKRLDSQPWDVQNGDLATFVTEYCIDRALFQMISSPGTWVLSPGSIELSHLLRRADPVVARINTEITD
jgi:hypothetical protein